MLVPCGGRRRWVHSLQAARIGMKVSYNRQGWSDLVDVFYVASTWVLKGLCTGRQLEA